MGKPPESGAAPATVRGLKPPQAGFDPLTVGPAALLKCGLPPAPDPLRQASAYALWRRVFAPPARFVDPRCMPRRTQRGTPSQSRPTLATAGGGSRADSRIATSRNWSGASIVPSGGRMFVVMGGTWTVPVLSLPPSAEQSRAAKYICSIWIGLDGQRLYPDSSLPQIGTMQTLTPATTAPRTTAQAFFQWWDHENGGTLCFLPGLSVRPGDVMTGAIWVQSPTRVIAALRNQRSNEVACVTADAPTVTVAAGVSRQLTVSGATAEWILERPTRLGSTELDAFPDYGTAMFTDCCAGEAVAPGACGAVVERDLTPARIIRLFDEQQDPVRTVMLSLPDARSAECLRLRYHKGSDVRSLSHTWCRQLRSLSPPV